MDAYHHDQRGGEDRGEGRDCDDENDPSPFVIPIPWPYDAPRAGLVPAGRGVEQRVEGLAARACRFNSALGAWSSRDSNS